MATYQVEFKVDLPDDAPTDEAEAFISFELGERASLRITHEGLKCTDLHSCNVRDVWVRQQ